MQHIYIREVQAKGASDTFLEWLRSLYEERAPIEYATVLEKLAEADRPDDAHWLMDTLGPSLTYPLDFDTRWVEHRNVKHIFAAGDLDICGDLDITGWVRAGGQIHADGDLRAWKGVKSGSSLRVLGDVHTGGYIDVGGRIQIDGSLTAWKDLSLDYGMYVGGDLEVNGKITAGRKLDAMMAAMARIWEFDHPEAESLQQATQTLLSAMAGYAEPWTAILQKHGPLEIWVKGDLSTGAGIDYDLTIRCDGRLVARGGVRSNRPIERSGPSDDNFGQMPQPLNEGDEK